MVNLIFTTAIFAQFFLVPVVIGAPSEPRRNVSVTVVGGSEAEEGQFPYQVYLAMGGSYCGGSIYDAKTIITAAHCVVRNNQKLRTRDFEIYAGSTEPRRGQRRLARYVTPHENYNPGTLNNDIAIIGLSQPFSFSKNVQPIPLTPSEMTLETGTTCVVSGFGRTSNERSTTNLQYAAIDIKPDEICISNNKRDWNPESMVCAAGDGTDSCNGDSGGPMACPVDGKMYHYGIVSFGNPQCATEGDPGTYSKISYFNSWVRQNVR